jgi:thioredoxin reductase
VNRSTGNLLHAVIVGAGPYGLSLAAHLREAGVPFRIFGHPMQSWATQMPVGMKLKSDGFASSLSAGSVPFTLEDFCTLTGRPYHATSVPVALEDFIAYGQEFARRFVPSLEPLDVTAIDREGTGFRVTLESGETFLTRNVILATGVSLFQHIPAELAHLPADMVTHTTAHRTFDEFANRDVTVLGRGASSLNAAVLLHEAGARVTLLSRKAKVHVHSAADGKPRSLYQRLRHPISPLGYSLRSWLCSNMPGTFRSLPAPLRRILMYKHLGPSGGSALKGRFEGKFPTLLGWSIASAEVVAPADSTADARQLRLTLTNAELETRELLTSHLIAGTGFHVDLSRYGFLTASLRALIHRQANGAPWLGRHFETSVKGLYMIGPVAAASFGQLLRFAVGAGYAATRVTTHLHRDLARVATSKPAFNNLPTPARPTTK